MHSEATARKGRGINANVRTSLCRISFFPENKLLLRVVGPVVDTIGKLERGQLTSIKWIWSKRKTPIWLGELIRQNWLHAIDSNLLFGALYLHPMCHGIAVSRLVANSCNLTNVKSFLLQLAEHWKLSSKASALLCDNVDEYHNFEGKFAENSLNALKHWEELALPPSQNPLISVAIHIFSMVPHAGSHSYSRSQSSCISKLKQLVVIKQWTTYNKREKGEGKVFQWRKGGRQDELETQTVEEIEDYNELDIIGDLEEAVSADEDLVTHLQLELKKAKEEMAEATRLGREHLPGPLTATISLLMTRCFRMEQQLRRRDRRCRNITALQIRPGIQTKFFK
ncbi:hypothetical protein BT69DRAFT_1297592 [Atractiella rhizophila]|nr:hypothetical protein BT69DRAFT_1297592 [Atractiella rhizophila]